MDQSAIGARIREARLKKKLTQEQLAEKADIGFYYIGEIERSVIADSLLKDELTASPEFNNEITAKLEKLNPKQRAGAVAILDAYIKAL